MLNRRKNLSHKQRREQMMIKRAVKRGDISPPPPLKPDRRQRKPRNPTVELPAHARHARRLQSEFIKLPAPFLKKTEILASYVPLTRPVPPEAAILADVDSQPPSSAEGTSTQLEQLTCPRRPKWRYDMSKKEIEANEEGLFNKWLAQVDAAANAWCSAEEPPPPAPKEEGAADEPEQEAEPEQMPHAPTSFERNLEVYRQIWRVTEISQILLILLDARCPTLHFPPSLAHYLSNVSNADRLRTILVLTKVDIVGPERAAAWTRDLQARFPGMRVVQVESYMEKHSDAMAAVSRHAHKPFLPSVFRRALVDALRATHAELLEPPESVKADPKRLANWKPRIKKHVDWDAVLQAHGGQVGSTVTGAAAPKADKSAPEGHTDGEHTDEESEPEVLTVGVIGQPNVGKSSLLNALFGATKVKASSTPGKTKHFQTLFWTPEVRLVDCPGLIFPNYIPMETQVLSGILPIARVSAIPLCIHHAAQLLPLEHVLDLPHPSVAEPQVEYKRTWRAGMHPHSEEEKARPKPQTWKANDILTAYAEKKGWVTARVGRPDVKRAGNAILRALADGRIRWAFWPPGTDAATIEAHQPIPGAGIWVGHSGHDLDDEAHPDHDRDEDEHSDDDSPEEHSDGDDIEEGEEEEDEDEDEDEAGADDDVVAGGKPKLAGTASRFSALELVDAEPDADDDEDRSAA